ncbi:hypothetical protein G6F23_015862 [Rhizopus arrhizus]|nr:hypothetical protein G6F23_015862 [Rhizopus arrhizus]
MGPVVFAFGLLARHDQSLRPDGHVHFHAQRFGDAVVHEQRTRELRAFDRHVVGLIDDDGAGEHVGRPDEAGHEA